MKNNKVFKIKKLFIIVMVLILIHFIAYLCYKLEKVQITSSPLKKSIKVMDSTIQVIKVKQNWRMLVYIGNVLLASLLVLSTGGSIYYWFRIKRISNELMDKNHLLYLLENDLQHVYMVIDLNKNRIKYAPPNIYKFIAEEDFKKIREDLKAHKYLERYIVDKEAYQSFISAFQKAKSGEHNSLYIKIRNKTSDKDIWVNVYFYALEKSDIIISLQDVTQAYEQQAKLKEALEKTQIAEQAKTQFLANISHEMRTPMNAIMGLTEIGIKNAAKMGCTECEQRFRNTEKVSEHLLELINNLLDIEKVSSGKVTLNESAIYLPDLVEDILHIINQRIEDKNQQLLLNVDVMGHPYVIGDELRLKQVIINLLSNANKFTPNQGKITWEMKEEVQDDSYMKLKIVIKDTGIGIEKEDQKKIFNVFEQVGHRYIGAYEGTGLGLPLTKDIVELMQGKIEVESKLGEGSKFTVNVLLKKATKEQYNKDKVLQSSSIECLPKIESEQEEKRILLVDDVDINRMIVEELLSEYPYMIEMATNGKECVEKFEASPEGYYDMILMDVQMPLMNGYEAAKTIRSSNRQDANKVSIIAMSANVYKEDMEEAQKAGMNDYIGKPISFERLITTLQKY